MDPSHYTPIKQISKIRSELRATFRTGLTKPLSFRRQQLLQLARLLQENEALIADALNRDLGRPIQESYMSEISVLIPRIITIVKELHNWAQDEDKTSEVPDWQKTWKPRVEHRPKGTVLIIAPWNYPTILSLQPLYGAISAGCCVLLKPSEFSPHYSSLIASLIPKYLDPSAYRVVLGAVPEITRVLELQWDHIFYTGNARVARVISAAAAKHLTPLTLELGGKSPVIIDPNCNLSLAARRIILGKLQNCGQLCVTPDYVLCPRDRVPALVTALREQINEQFPEGSLDSSDISRIVSDGHFNRLRDLMTRTKGKMVVGGKIDVEGKLFGNINLGGKQSKRKGIELTVYTDVKGDDALMEEEIFGPLLPIISVDSVDDAIEFINDRPHPLVLYAFTQDEKLKRKILDNTTSGNVVLNDTTQQLSVSEMPFGGVGESGHGRQIMRYSFEDFSYVRSVMDIPAEMEPLFKVRYPPYTQESLEFFAAPLKLELPRERVEENGHAVNSYN